MDTIEEIFSNPVYEPFLSYCRKHRMQTMQDMRRCRFDELALCAGLTVSLCMRIKSVYAAYCKKHPDVLIGAPITRSRAPAKSRIDPMLEPRLREYFQEHADSLVRLTDLTKSLGARRSDLLKTLEDAPWCKSVDATTFFFSPQT